MAKRKFTAKQLANQKRFARMVKAGFKRPKSVNVPMAKRRSSRRTTVVRYARRGSKRASGMLGSARGIFRSAAGGIGGAVVAEAITQRVFPQAQPFAGLAGAYIGGGMKGIIAKVAYDAITGNGGLLSVFGGAHSASTQGVDSL